MLVWPMRGCLASTGTFYAQVYGGERFLTGHILADMTTRVVRPIPPMEGEAHIMTMLALALQVHVDDGRGLVPSGAHVGREIYLI